MKKSYITILFLFSLFVSQGAHAKNLTDAFEKNTLDTAAGVEGAGYDTDVSDPTIIVALVIQTFLSLLGVIFLVLILYGGYLWMTDRGSTERVDKAKKVIQAAVIGLIIVIAAYAISYFVIKKLGTGTLK